MNQIEIQKMVLTAAAGLVFVSIASMIITIPSILFDTSAGATPESAATGTAIMIILHIVVLLGFWKAMRTNKQGRLADKGLSIGLGMDPIARRRTIRLIREWARAGKSVIVSSHILHEVEAMTSNILLINNGRILAEGDVHQIRELIDEHPHTVYIKAADPRGLARLFLTYDHVLNLKLEAGAGVVQTGQPDDFYTALTAVAASGEFGTIEEVTSPDDNLQAVFSYLVET